MRIDAHTHFFPSGLDDFAAITGDSRWPSLTVKPDGSANIMRGDTVYRPVSETCWNLDARRAAMDADGTDTHVLSPVPVTLTTWADAKVALRFAQAHNDAFAEAVRAQPSGRFEWIGTVPLQDVGASVRELERAVNELGMRGVEIGTEVNGRELDDPTLDPFFAAAEALDVAVFVHPTSTPNVIRRGGVPYEFALGMHTDTGMAATALVFGGVIEKYPRLRIGLAHGCGSFPWSFPRIARGNLMPGAAHPMSIERAAEVTRHLWTDTLVFDGSHLPLLIERFGVDHLMLGSDFPFYPPTFGPADAPINECIVAGTCTDHDAAAMLGDNARAFYKLTRTP